MSTTPPADTLASFTTAYAAMNAGRLPTAEEVWEAAQSALLRQADAKPYPLRFPTMLRKMWSGGEVQAWLDALPPLYTHWRHIACPPPADSTEAAEREHLGCAHCRTGIYAAQPRSDQNAGASQNYAEALASELARQVAELPDRTSPAVDPEAMLATAQELSNCLHHALERLGLQLVSEDTFPVSDNQPDELPPKMVPEEDFVRLSSTLGAVLGVMHREGFEIDKDAPLDQEAARWLEWRKKPAKPGEHPVEQVHTLATLYANEGGHGVIVSMLRAYAKLLTAQQDGFPEPIERAGAIVLWVAHVFNGIAVVDAKRQTHLNLRFERVNFNWALTKLQEAAALLGAPSATQPVEPVGDAIEPSKRILALVDDYQQSPTTNTRATLRYALMDEFSRLLAVQRSRQVEGTGHAARPIDLQGLSDRLLAPREIDRDDLGWLVHPALPTCDEDVPISQFLAAFGLEAYVRTMEADVSDERYARYHEENAGCADWNPTPPPGDGWTLLEIYDTENGPHALFARMEPKEC